MCTDPAAVRQPNERNEHDLRAGAGSSQYGRTNDLHRKLEYNDEHPIPGLARRGEHRPYAERVAPTLKAKPERDAPATTKTDIVLKKLRQLSLDHVREQRVRKAPFLRDRVEGLAKVRDRVHFHQFPCGKLVTHDDWWNQR